jgi:hypothetical protein
LEQGVASGELSAGSLDRDAVLRALACVPDITGCPAPHEQCPGDVQQAFAGERFDPAPAFVGATREGDVARMFERGLADHA